MSNRAGLAMPLACFGSILLGFAPLFVRLTDLGPLGTGFYRILFAMPFLWLWHRYDQKQQQTALSLTDIGVMTAAGVFFALDLALSNTSLDYTVIVNSSLFNNSAIFFVPLLSWFLFGQKPTRRLLMCVTLSLFGVYLLFQESLNISIEYLLGDAMALVSGLLFALYVITIKKVRNHIPAGSLMYWTAFPTALTLLVISPFMGESLWPLTTIDLVTTLGQAVMVHLLGQSLLTYSMGQITANQGAIALLLSPVTAAITGVIFYDEDLSFIKIIGVTLILVSIVLVKEGKKAARRKEASLEG